MSLESRLAAFIGAVGADIKQLKSSAISAVVPIEPWRTVGAAGQPAFQNGWNTPYGAAYAAQFRKRPDGVVELRGLISGGALGLVFTLPVGYRPAGLDGIQVVGTSTSPRSLSGLSVSPAGDVTADAIGAPGWTSLADIRFSTDQATFPTGPPGIQGPAGPVGGNATVPIEPWHTVGAAGEPAFNNTWGALSASYPVQFRKRPDGVVELRGLAQKGTNPGNYDSIFSLPVGYRPVGQGEMYFDCDVLDAKRVSVYAGGNGTVALGDITGLGIVANKWVSLSGIRFTTDQATFPTGPQGIPGGTATFVSALPSNPTDGQEVFYQNAAMAADGIIWHLRYRAAASGAYKWDVVSGSSLISEIITSETTGSGSYVALGTPGPVVTLPLSGDYIVAVGCGVANTAAAQETWMSYDIGATPATDSDKVSWSASATEDKAHAVMRERRKTGLGAVALTAKYRVGGGTGRWQERWLRATPIRVG